MNEPDPSAVPAVPTAPPIIGTVSPTANPEPPPLPKPFSWWLRKLFACNPFYLVSAALLLYGCYRLSVDTAWFHGETARMFASFTSVQCYELLLVGTAIFLARRSLWYDSTLLVGLENLLVFVPFILISQAALTDAHMAQGICITGAGLALLRFGSLKKFFTQLNLPGRLLGMGTLLLALNVALPLIYRHYGETKIGVHMDSGPAYEMNEYTWLLILPAALALGNFLPCARALGNLPHQHRWLPDGLFGLWVIATIMHVYCLDYIYQFDLRPDLIAPGLWILAWMGWLNFPEKTNRWHTVGKLALETAPLLIALAACSAGINRVFYVLAALNITVYLVVCFIERENRFVRHLLAGAVLVYLAGLPEAWLQAIHHDLSHATCAIIGVMAYAVFCTALSKNPKLALLGSLIVGMVVGSAHVSHPMALAWAFQSALVFLLLHSLRWNDPAFQGAKLVRGLAGLLWVSQSLLWMNAGGGKFWMPLIPALLVLAVYVVAQMRQGKWTQPIVPAAAILTLLSGPGNALGQIIYAMPVGMMAVVGSFVLFGCGTAAALTRGSWHRTEDTENKKT
jgi:hypothetical protein